MLSNFENLRNYFLTDPLEQFAVISLDSIIRNLPAFITNLNICFLLNLMIIHFLFFNSTQIKYISDLTVFDLIARNFYSIVKNIVKSNIISKRYQYFTILFYLFLFIFISNLVGLIPYSYTVTSSFIITFFLAATHFIGINLIAIVSKKWEFGSLFLPSGVPVLIAPLLVPIEFISYIARIFSLSIRLFANMMSGHALLKILIGFSWTMLGTGIMYTIIALFP
jgi:ATP synthase subunit 6